METKESKPAYQEWKSKQPTEPVNASDSPATKALEFYTTATRRYLITRERYQEATETARKLALELQESHADMTDARARLDGELAGETPTPAVKPPEAKPTARPRFSNLPPRECEVCGKSYTPKRETARFCSRDCFQVWNRVRQKPSNGHATAVGIGEASA